jgi:type 1 fimbria pilin
VLASQVQVTHNLSFKGVLVAQACTIRPGDELIPVKFSESIRSGRFVANSTFTLAYP